MRKHTILLVDDDPIIIIGTGRDLERNGYEVTTANDGEEAVELLNKSSFDLVLTDLVMGQIDGIGVLKKAKEINPETMVMIFTGFGDITSAIDVLRLHADDYMLKPCEPEEMYFRISRCLDNLELKRKIKAYEDILPICMTCKKIRDDTDKEQGAGDWMEVKSYVSQNVGTSPSSCYCPECLENFQEETKKMI